MKTITNEEAVTLLEAAEKMSHGERMALQQERLRYIVSYARENSPYFRELYKNIPEDFTLSDLPMTRKEELSKHYNTWVTDPEATHEAALSYLETAKPGELFLSKYSVLHTSGTTGEPMTLLRDSYHNVIHGAMVARRLLGPDGAEMMNIRKHKRASVVFADKGASAYSSMLRIKAANPGFEDNITAVSTTEPTSEIIRKVQEFQPEAMSGYPSSLALLADAKRQGKLNISVKFIASSAEVMSEEIYKFLKETFDCRVVNNYCSTEGGEAAMASDCSHLHINEDWIIIEPVDAEGNPVQDPAEWSEGILVTDLTNQIQPIIRYYMSDRVKIRSELCDCGNGFPWMEIRGRVGGLFNFCGKTMMYVTLETACYDIAYVHQFLQYSDTEMEIRAIPKTDSTREKALQEIRNCFEEYLRREGITDGYKIRLSMEDPIKNERGGKISVYKKMY